MKQRTYCKGAGNQKMMSSADLTSVLCQKKKKKRNNTKNDFFKCENMKQARSIYQRSTKRRPPLRQSLQILHNLRPRCPRGRSSRTKQAVSHWATRPLHSTRPRRTSRRCAIITNLDASSPPGDKIRHSPSRKAHSGPSKDLCFQHTCHRR